MRTSFESNISAIIGTLLRYDGPATGLVYSQTASNVSRDGTSYGGTVLVVVRVEVDTVSSIMSPVSTQIIQFTLFLTQSCREGVHSDNNLLIHITGPNSNSFAWVSWGWCGV